MGHGDPLPRFIFKKRIPIRIIREIRGYIPLSPPTKKRQPSDMENCRGILRFG